MLERARFYVDRTTGSHYILHHSDGRGSIPVPFHRGRDVKGGVLHSTIRQSGLTREEVNLALRISRDLASFPEALALY